jgi:twitching motility protein PilT
VKDPDIILVGEMRDLETIELALTASATGHLVDRHPAHSDAHRNHRSRDRRLSRRPAKPDSRQPFGIAQRRRCTEPLPPHRPSLARFAVRWRFYVCDTQIANLDPRSQDSPDPGYDAGRQKEGQQPLDDAILEHLRAARISPEEAYEKCSDKKKFRPFIKNPVDDWED